MDLEDYFKNHGEYIGANMWEIYIKESNDMIHLAESTRLDTLPRFFLNGSLSDEDTVSILLDKTLP